MLNDNAKYFTEDFKTKTITKIRAARLAFCMETFRAGLDDIQAKPYDFSTVDYHPGRRFFSDEECWNAFVTVITKGQPWVHRHDHINKAEASTLEFEMDRNEEEWRRSIWKAMKAAAECDHHYTYEKEY